LFQIYAICYPGQFFPRLALLYYIYIYMYIYIIIIIIIIIITVIVIGYVHSRRNIVIENRSFIYAVIENAPVFR
jgi:hypothetical protein